MAAAGVVEHLDVVEQITPGRGPGQIDLATDPLPLQQLEEALGDRVVVTVSPAAHAAIDAMGLEEGLPVAAGELAALVRGQHQAGLRLATPNRRRQRLKNQVGLHVPLRSPADNLAREQVQNDRQVKPALVSPDIGDIGDPMRVRRRHRELPVEPVWRHRRRKPAARPRSAAIADLCFESFGPHQAIDPVLSAGFSQDPKVASHLAIAVDCTALEPGVLHQSRQPAIFLRPVTHRCRQPRIEARALHAQDPASSQTRSGSPTSPISGRRKGGFTSLRLSICTHGAPWAGRCSGP